ncbi:MAG: hypothetical protein ABW034_17005 [Steroidobacteraceae bacterium]
MTSARSWLIVLMSLPMLDAAAADTCECPDIADLRNREAEERAAIQAYQSAIARWAGAPPAASETSRTEFQASDIQTAINAVTTSGSNKATGKTDAACSTTIDETTTCMKEVAAQHEHVHAEACRVAREQSALSFSRWSTLADYAREEIAAYQAEAAYAHAALVNLQSKCQLEIEMTSEIRGGTEVAVSNATANVSATFAAPDHQATTGYRGTGKLEYKTKDVGPPKKVGDAMLMKLVPVCYSTSVGSGTTPFNVLDGYFWRGNTPPYEPRLDLSFEIHQTDEDHILKGERGCPKSKSKQPFWSDKFLLDKQATTAANHILIDGWTFAPRPGVYAEKVLNGTCGEAAELPGRLAAYGPIVACVEKTTFTVRLKR